MLDWADSNIAFMPAEAAVAMSAEQMLVTMSRPRDEFIVVTDSIAVVRQQTTQSEERESAREFLRDSLSRVLIELNCPA